MGRGFREKQEKGLIYLFGFHADRDSSFPNSTSIRASLLGSGFFEMVSPHFVWVMMREHPKWPRYCSDSQKFSTCKNLLQAEKSIKGYFFRLIELISSTHP